jgi:hypothetical protein
MVGFIELTPYELLSVDGGCDCCVVGAIAEIVVGFLMGGLVGAVVAVVSAITVLGAF